jgi:hypothetical protein
MPATALWIASNASLLYLRFVFTAYLHELFELHFLGYVVLRFPGVQFSHCPEPQEFVIFDVGSILLRKQIRVDPMLAAASKD